MNENNNNNTRKIHFGKLIPVHIDASIQFFFLIHVFSAAIWPTANSHLTAFNVLFSRDTKTVAGNTYPTYNDFS